MVLDLDPDDEAARLPPDPASRLRLIEPLTARELQILGLVCDGWSNREICARLGITLPTVKFHVTHVFGKLGVRRRTQAVALAVHLQLVRPEWMERRPLEGVGHLLARASATAAGRRQSA
ncbi:MAG: hypothetical protein C0434_11135 [Xanthomonadaceae bacterium]|nr:hypothetical protein [Xanthomonadaceae bacterium]